MSSEFAFLFHYLTYHCIIPTTVIAGHHSRMTNGRMPKALLYWEGIDIEGSSWG